MRKAKWKPLKCTLAKKQIKKQQQQQKHNSIAGGWGQWKIELFLKSLRMQRWWTPTIPPDWGAELCTVGRYRSPKGTQQDFPWTYELWLPTWALCVLWIQEPAGKNRSHHSGMRRLYNRGMEEYAWHSRDPTGHFLVYPSPVLTRNAQVWQFQSKTGIVTRSSSPSRMRV